MTVLSTIPPLTSFWTQGGRLHVCPMPDGVYLSVERHGISSQELTLSREQALDLLRLLQENFAGEDG
ncbi:hypothetical protein DAERI_010029 [Deinococcus aerius]|uniref:Uncharacterized protein n=1 Tax=Deinococcus aerius TaxID=200253 RepID=A0A2I9DP45_9DEIO|nr:hypothetical protein DAERI_010029 [Deinococcus aerius]